MKKFMLSLLVITSFLITRPLYAQEPIATGDARPATEPSIPTVTSALCHHYYASLTTSYAASAYNSAVVKPEPSSETAFDSGLQTDLNSCSTTSSPNNVVELSVDTAGDNALLITQLNIPTGVTLIIDGGVTLFASANPCKYQARLVGSTYEAVPNDTYCYGGSNDVHSNYCGQIAASHYYCMPVITLSTNSNIMGYGTIDGRGYDTMLGPNNVSSLSLPYTTYYGMSYYAQTNGFGGKQASPDLISGDGTSASGATNVALYKLTLMDSPYYNILWVGPTSGSTPTQDFTAWGIKILAPSAIENTDGIDIRNLVKNATISHSYISNGDDNVALASYGTSSPTENVTLNYVSTFSGFGLSIGNVTQGGISNVLMNQITQMGLITQTDGVWSFAQNSYGTGLHLKSSSDNGGVVDTVTYENACIESVPSPIHITPFQGSSNTGTQWATFSNITLKNVTINPNVNINGTPISGLTNYFNTAGADSGHKTTIWLDNVYWSVTPTFSFNINQSTANPQYDGFTYGATQGITIPGSTTFATAIDSVGSNLTFSGTNNAATASTSCSYNRLNGELYLSGTSFNNATSWTIHNGQTININAVLQPSSEDFPTLANNLQFYDGSTAIGVSVALQGNFAATTFTAPSTPGTVVHTITGRYSVPGPHQDPNYGEFDFGPVSITVSN